MSIVIVDILTEDIYTCSTVAIATYVNLQHCYMLLSFCNLLAMILMPAMILMIYFSLYQS